VLIGDADEYNDAEERREGREQPQESPRVEAPQGNPV
jgi:hypothetical protein